MNGRVSFGGGGDAAEDLVHFFHLFQGELAQHGDFGGLFEVGLRQVVGGQDVQLGQLLFDEQPFLMDEVGLELIETVGDGEVALVQAVLGLRGAGVEESVAHGDLDGRGRLRMTVGTCWWFCVLCLGCLRLDVCVNWIVATMQSCETVVSYSCMVVGVGL